MDELLLTDAEIDKAVNGTRYYGQTQAANSWLRDRAIAKAQLEKATKYYGEKHFNDVMGAKKSGFDEGKAEGRRELIEFLKKHKQNDDVYIEGTLLISKEDWQQLLKELGE